MHTKPPWKVEPDAVEGHCHMITAEEEYEPREFCVVRVAREVSYEDARRIVACVAVCEGISTADLEIMAAEGMTF